MSSKPEKKCECNYHLGVGPNLQCPVHGADTCRQFGITPHGRAVLEADSKASKAQIGIMTDMFKKLNKYFE